MSFATASLAETNRASLDTTIRLLRRSVWRFFIRWPDHFAARGRI